MGRYRRLKPRRFRQATFLAPPPMLIDPPPRRKTFPVFGLAGLLIILAGMTALVLMT